jgi:hypothetical protein
MTNWILRNDELVCVPFDELTDHECEHLAWWTEYQLWMDVSAFIRTQNDEYCEEEE